ncbi:hypothetical protein GCM10009117_02820 [Gangjinia marincola]|uniref:DUF4149 domain-containing protein n=1 Tax=Gangjinia marincola TaxID=578463 RepID=A0ABN1MDL1_9FLAO
MYHVHQYSLLLDFGLVVLIWIVQLIIYPGFTFYAKENLARWHKVYTPRITYIVLPLMVGQAAMAVYFLSQSLDSFTLSYTGLIILVWLNTFLQAVPLHTKIQHSTHGLPFANKLVTINWSRTILWNVLFILHLIQVHRLY